MRFLIFTFGTRGDVQPYLALGAELQKCGHQVIVATGQGFEDLIRCSGLEPRSLSIDFRRLLETPEVRAALTTTRGKLAAWRMMKRETDRQYDEMWEICRDEAPDAMVVSPKGFLGVVFAGVLGIPCFNSTLQPNFSPRADFPHFLLSNSLGAWGNRLSYQTFNQLTLWGQNRSIRSWLERRLPAASKDRLTGFYGYHPQGKRLPLLHGYSAHLVSPPQGLGSQTQGDDVVTGYWFGAPPKEGLSDELEEFLQSGSPPVYVGFGSMPASDAERITEAVLQGVARTKRRVILARGWGGLKRQAARSADVFDLEGAPHALLFPRCAAVVHHGGAGTTHEGLRWGRPSVIYPAGVDQPFWARRLVALGLAERVTSLARLHADDLFEQLRFVLSPEREMRFESVRSALAAEQGAAAAARVVLAALG